MDGMTYDSAKSAGGRTVALNLPMSELTPESLLTTIASIAIWIFAVIAARLIFRVCRTMYKEGRKRAVEDIREIFDTMKGIGALLFMLCIFLGLLYGFVRFVKWAWRG